MMTDSQAGNGRTRNAGRPVHHAPEGHQPQTGYRYRLFAELFGLWKGFAPVKEGFVTLGRDLVRGPVRDGRKWVQVFHELSAQSIWVRVGVLLLLLEILANVATTLVCFCEGTPELTSSVQENVAQTVSDTLYPFRWLPLIVAFGYLVVMVVRRPSLLVRFLTR